MKNLKDIMNVGMGQKKKADSSTSQHTNHLKPCLGVGFYNKKNKESYMLHYPDLMFYDFENDAKRIAKDLGKNIEITACGGSLSSKQNTGYNKAITDDRGYVERVLYKIFGKKKVQLDWSTTDQIAEMTIDKNRNKIIVKKSKSV